MYGVESTTFMIEVSYSQPGVGYSWCGARQRVFPSPREML